MIKYLQPTSPLTCRHCRALAPLGFPSLSKSSHYYFCSIKREVVSTHMHMCAHTLREKERSYQRFSQDRTWSPFSAPLYRVISHAPQVWLGTMYMDNKLWHWLVLVLDIFNNVEEKCILYIKNNLEFVVHLGRYS